MIEREFVARKKLEFQIQEFISENLKGVGLSHSKLQRTPLGEKIIIYASRPGLIIGGGGTNIKKLTKQLKKKCGLENPQIEIAEVENVNLVSSVVAERIASALEKYGTMRFKGVGHKAMADTIGAGARGIEILISGKIPSARARTWRFYQGYLKKSGDVAVSQVDIAYTAAKLKSGIVGIKVSIMPPNVKLPDEIKFVETPLVEELPTKEAEAVVAEITEKALNEEKKRKPRKKKASKMKTSELKSKSNVELEAQLSEMNKELIKLNTQVATGTTLKSPGQVKKIKKNIARLMTQLQK